jgi:hypothetical protein
MKYMVEYMSGDDYKVCTEQVNTSSQNLAIKHAKGYARRMNRQNKFKPAATSFIIHERVDLGAGNFFWKSIGEYNLSSGGVKIREKITPEELHRQAEDVLNSISIKEEE